MLENVKTLSKTPPLKLILQFQDRICFFLLKRHTKNNHSSASDLVSKTMLEAFLKILRISRLKEYCKTYTKKKSSNQKLKQ